MGLLEWDRVELVAENNEPILEVIAHEGETLEANAIILRQDPRRVQAKLDEAEALRAQAQSRLAELKRGPRAERIEEARAQLQGALSDEENSRKELTRMKKLLAKKLISQEAVDNARTQLDKSMATKNAAHAVLEELLHGTTVEELQQAEAAVAQVEASVRALKITLENLTLRAPRKGVIDSLPYKSGERPETGAVVAVMLIGSKPYARVYVPEPLRAHVHLGTQAMIFVDGIDKPFPGQVRMISSDAVFTPYYSLTERDRSRLSYLAEVELTDNKTQQLPSGVPVRVDFQATEH
jgi:HlyD family secretion protein